MKIIRAKLSNGEIDNNYLMSGHYFFVDYKNIKYIISTSDEKDENIPSINFEQCTSKLKKSKNLPEDAVLYMSYIIVSEPEMNIPKIEYEIYSLNGDNSYEKFDLEKCKDVKIDIAVAVDISEEDLDKYNTSSGYYNDVCYTYTSDKGTDITLKDRRNEFIENNMAICQDRCELASYDSQTGTAHCSCAVISSVSDISDIKIDQNELKSNFININNIANINILKCYNRLFSSDFGNNIGCIVITVITGFSIISVFIFVNYSYNAFNTQVQSIFDVKLTIEAKEKTTNEENKNTPSRQLPSKILTLKNSSNDVQAPPKRSFIDNSTDEEKKNNIDQNQNNDLAINVEENKGASNTSKNLEDTPSPIEKSYRQYNSLMKYNDSEMNLLSYPEALENDFRSCNQYYVSLVRTKHLLIFSFCSTKDYNSRLIKIILFFFTFAVEFSINALFFNDSTMHKIYEDEGKFILEYHIPQIIYSIIVSSVLVTLVKITALTESNVLKIKSAKGKDLMKTYTSETKYIKCKFISFFIIVFILLLFFWYYLGCFCAVYKNTQSQLLSDTLISFAVQLLYPLFLYFIPGAFRISALQDQERDSKYKYNFGKFIQEIL